MPTVRRNDCLNRVYRKSTCIECIQLSPHHNIIPNDNSFVFISKECQLFHFSHWTTCLSADRQCTLDWITRTTHFQNQKNFSGDNRCGALYSKHLRPSTVCSPAFTTLTPWPLHHHYHSFVTFLHVVVCAVVKVPRMRSKLLGNTAASVLSALIWVIAKNFFVVDLSFIARFEIRSVTRRNMLWRTWQPRKTREPHRNGKKKKETHSSVYVYDDIENNVQSK